VELKQVGAMGLTAPSLKDMDCFEVSRKRKPAKLNANGTRRAVNVIMWTVDGSAVLAHPQRGRSECCTVALWRRIMGRGHAHSRIANDEHCHPDSVDLDLLELGQPHKARMWADVGPKLQTAFGMRRWPQGWI
jgi:hypothetical protein